jgi:hypothetical protein
MFRRNLCTVEQKFGDFPVPSRDVTHQSLPGIIFPRQGEFGKRHPGWGRENRQPFFTVCHLFGYETGSVEFDTIIRYS